MKRSRLAARSPKRRREEPIYRRLRLAFLRAHPWCELGARIAPVVPGWLCRGQRRANQVHHRRGRGRWYLVVEFWSASCAECHRFVTENGKTAEGLGLVERVYERRDV